MKILVTKNQVKLLSEQLLDPIGKFLSDLEKIDVTNLIYKDYKINQDIKNIQIGLTFLGLNPETNIDGKFGPITLDSIRKFSKSNNIKNENEIIPRLVSLIEKSPKKDELKSLITIGSSKIKSKKVSVNNIGDGKKIIDFFVSKGLTPEQAAGIAGNLYIESGFNTTILGDGGMSYGLAQWHKERRTNLFNWAKSKNLDPKDFITQLKFLWKELNTTELSSLNKLRQTDSPSSAAASFAKNFERPASKDYSARSGAAENIYSAYTGYKFY